MDWLIADILSGRELGLLTFTRAARDTIATNV
jgi:hypothetical protein